MSIHRISAGQAADERRLYLFLLLVLLAGLSIGMVKVTTPLFALSLGASKAEIGFITGSQPLMMALVSLPIGIAIGSVGARGMFMLGSVLAGAVYFLTPFADSPY
ncbi:MAG: hypothetical protein PHT19_14975 [Methylococcus sp.]|nr:hypothetical protein [Methylococcus sp.]